MNSKYKHPKKFLKLLLCSVKINIEYISNDKLLKNKEEVIKNL